MRACLTLHVSAIKLVQTLKRDGATFFRAEPVGDFPPRPPLLALFADVAGERLKAAAVCPSAAVPGSLRLLPISGFRIHRNEFTAGIDEAVSEQWAS
jgi:hypothetical protein